MVDFEQEIKIEVTRMNKNFLKKMGYIVKEGEKIKLKLRTLKAWNMGTKYYADVRCDYCNTPFKILIGNLFQVLKMDNPKIACKKCGSKKTKETNLMRYGVESSFYREDVLEKIEKTNLERWGVPHVAQSKEFQEIRKETNLQKYGSISPLGNQEVYEKSKQTLFEHYGVENPSQSDIIQEKVRKTLNSHGLEKVSKQQKQLWEYIGGELNYPFGRYSLDIAYIDEKIDIEYNGGGHNLTVKMGTVSESKFIQNETYRKKQLYADDWKIITFISPRSKLLSKELILNVISSCKNYFNKENRHWVEIYIDEKKIKTSQFETTIEKFINNYNGERLNEKDLYN